MYIFPLCVSVILIHPLLFPLESLFTLTGLSGRVSVGRGERGGERRRCKLVASDQISRVCLCCSLPHSLLPLPRPSAVSQENNGNSQRESSGGAAKCVAGQTDTAATQRGGETAAAKRCQVTPPFTPSPRGRRSHRRAQQQDVWNIFLPIARALAPYFTNGVCLQSFKCSVIVNIQSVMA